jgi:hypothetical protein
MKEFTAIGYWNDGLYYHDYIWPQEIVSDEPVENAKEIAEYLKQGVVATYWKGYSSCRICDKRLGTTCKTDGTFIWPDMLDHYVTDHNIVLPEEFVNHIKENNYEVPESAKDFDERKYEIRYAFWKNWCFANRDRDKDPQFQIKNFKVPKSNFPEFFEPSFVSTPALVSKLKSVKKRADVSPDVINDMFLPIEMVFDMLVDTLEVYSVDCFTDDVEKIMDEENGEFRIYCADVKENKPYIRATSSELPHVSVIFHKGQLYCSHQEMLFIKTKLKKVHCPELQEYDQKGVKI